MSQHKKTGRKAPRASGNEESSKIPHEDSTPLSHDWERGAGGIGRQKTGRSAPAKAPRTFGIKDSPENPHGALASLIKRNTIQ